MFLAAGVAAITPIERFSVPDRAPWTLGLPCSVTHYVSQGRAIELDLVSLVWCLDAQALEAVFRKDVKFVQP